jgi:hypothetical protein
MGAIIFAAIRPPLIINLRPFDAFGKPDALALA